MGMREEIQAELAEAFDDPDGLADAVAKVEGTRKLAAVYDPATGKTSSGSLNYMGRGVFSSYLAKEVDGSLIQALDEKLLTLQNELFVSEGGLATAVKAEPLIGDLIGGKRVLNVGHDPAGATWTIQLRK
ncbi:MULTISPECIES: hypothetical protein [Pseudomonas syringae group]|uniref:Uncharacterized protein n=1 Tax=Pseudomonas syringae pv. papulans TaxID=83963 RepID=A0A0P9Y687_PSESX|nr:MULTISPECIES: hypothetical protein [Pseudomonas syringae group]KPY33143.1 putative phage protein [Pseudomonas syringae pv. papulans]KWS33186.1 hypothetical protein AL059_12245 [Pseudomonas syringae pv. papulans]MDH4604578.1 hypothetical protein [Pseudomonas syringae pv. papulans]MDH4623781.1 hypothetical protein [Pseudomonas syringae pv. papulans]PHN54774.1 hypothetical protein AO286_19000 [Pseudomonas syringae]